MFLSPLRPLEVFLLIPPHPVALTQLRSLSSPRLGLKDLRRLKTSRVFVDNASPLTPSPRVWAHALSLSSEHGRLETLLTTRH